MPTSDTIKCPSGLAGTVRGLTVKDGRYLGDKRIARKGMMLDKILQHCWTSTSEPGPYEVNGDAPNWSRVLVGDRDVALINVRIESLGHEHEFKTQCEACDANFVWTVDLIDLLERGVQPLTPESLEVFKGENRFPVDVEIGGITRRLVHKLAVGADVSRHLQQQQRRRMAGKRERREESREENVLADAVELRLVSADGVESRELRDFIESLSFKELRRVIDAFDANDCGVNTSIEVECPFCDRVQVNDLPFDRDFFFPRMGKPAI